MFHKLPTNRIDRSQIQSCNFNVAWFRVMHRAAVAATRPSPEILYRYADLFSTTPVVAWPGKTPSLSQEAEGCHSLELAVRYYFLGGDHV
jgi:hypothetical protein